MHLSIFNKSIEVLRKFLARPPRKHLKVAFIVVFSHPRVHHTILNSRIENELATILRQTFDI